MRCFIAKRPATKGSEVERLVKPHVTHIPRVAALSTQKYHGLDRRPTDRPLGLLGEVPLSGADRRVAQQHLLHVSHHKGKQE